MSDAPGKATDAPLLEVRDLKKHYAVQRGVLAGASAKVLAVDGVSFTIPRGQSMGLVGESGCGKSTVGKTVLRLIAPTAGSIHLAGVDITRLSDAAMRPHRREMQMIFQDPFSSLNPKMSAGSIIGEPLIIHGIATGNEKNARVAELLRRVGLPADAMKKYAHEFSGGQRQRLGIARALALNPALVVCDEPVSALDVSIQAQIINLLLDLQQQYGLSYLFIAHDLAVVQYVSQVIAVMYLGRIVESADRKALFSRPLHPYTQALLSAVPNPEPTSADRRPVVPVGDLPSPINPPSGCHFHTRCPFAMDRCRAESPALKEVAPSHHVACHLH